jgi:hypothetical protein
MSRISTTVEASSVSEIGRGWCVVGRSPVFPTWEYTFPSHEKREFDQRRLRGLVSTVQRRDADGMVLLARRVDG